MSDQNLREIIGTQKDMLEIIRKTNEVMGEMLNSIERMNNRILALEEMSRGD